MTRRLGVLAAGMALAGMLVGGLTYAVVDARRTDADHVAEARREQARRIDQLQRGTDILTDRLASESLRSGRQEQAIADLRRQVRRLGGRPITGRESPARRQRAPSSGGAEPAPTAQPSPSQSPQPSEPPRRPDPETSPTPSPPGDVCLPLIGCL